MKELETAPWGLVPDIITARAYARAKGIVDNAKSEEDVPDDPMIDLVFEIQQDIIKERG